MRLLSRVHAVETENTRLQSDLLQRSLELKRRELFIVLQALTGFSIFLFTLACVTYLLHFIHFIFQIFDFSPDIHVSG